MSNLKSIDEYRSTRSLPECYPWVRELLEAIEAEVDERFVRERECVNEWDTELTGRLRFQCSACGAVSLEITPRYCPNCGAKVVSGE